MKWKTLFLFRNTERAIDSHINNVPWIEEALRVITQPAAIKPLLQNHFVSTLSGYIKFKKNTFV